MFLKFRVLRCLSGATRGNADRPFFVITPVAQLHNDLLGTERFSAHCFWRGFWRHRFNEKIIVDESSNGFIPFGLDQAGAAIDKTCLC